MPKILIYGSAGLLGLLFFIVFWPFVVIGPGDRGIVLNFGAVQPQILQPGLHVRIPVVQSIISMDVRVQKYTFPETAASLDLQEVTTSVAINYHIEPGEVNWIYRTIGNEDLLVSKILSPIISNSVKAVTAQYDASDLIVRRNIVVAKIDQMVRFELSKSHIMTDAVNITNFSFSKEYEQAIEAKQVAQQRAEQAQYELQQAKIDAERKVAQAKGEAEAMALKNKSVTRKIIMLDAVSKWDGTMPKVLGGAVPFFNMKDIDK